MRYKKIFIFVVTLFLFLFSVPTVNAQVIINEINPSGEWIELYKTSTGFLGLENCTIYFQDTKSQKKLLTSLDNFLESEQYKVILTGGSYLNNTSSDTVSLECADFVITPVVYPDNVSDKSYARIPNATGGFVLTSNISQGVQNPDPTPEPTSTPTITPAPTSVPTTSPTKTPTAVPTTQPTVKPTSIKTATPKPSPITDPTDEPAEQTTEPIVISEVTSSPLPTGLVAGSSTENKSPLLAIFFVVTGVGCLGYVGYLLYNQRHAKSQKTS